MSLTRNTPARRFATSLPGLAFGESCWRTTRGKSTKTEAPMVASEPRQPKCGRHASVRPQPESNSGEGARMAVRPVTSSGRRARIAVRPATSGGRGARIAVRPATSGGRGARMAVRLAKSSGRDAGMSDKSSLTGGRRAKFDHEQASKGARCADLVDEEPSTFGPRRGMKDVPLDTVGWRAAIQPQCGSIRHPRPRVAP
jgi:hypothetical protein